MQLRLKRPKEFQELVDAAITLEDDYKSIQEERRKNPNVSLIVNQHLIWVLNLELGQTTETLIKENLIPKVMLYATTVDIKDITPQSVDNQKSFSMDAENQDTWKPTFRINKPLIRPLEGVDHQYQGWLPKEGTLETT